MPRSGSLDLGYVYVGDENQYRVTMLRRDTAKQTAKVRVEFCISQRGAAGTIPPGTEITVPLRRIQ